MELKVTPWYSLKEWQYVRNLLFSFDGVHSMQRGIDLVNLWKTRVRQGALSVPVELTTGLLSAYIQVTEPADVSEESIRHAAAMAIVRFVNGITDQLQTGLYAQSVQIIADKLKIPDWLVDLRHEATHARLPSFEFLKTGLVVSLCWLEKNYWLETEQKIKEHENVLEMSLNNLINDFQEVVIDFLLLRTNTNEDSKDYKKGFTKCEEKNQKILKELSEKINLQTAVILRKLIKKNLIFVDRRIINTLHLSHFELTDVVDNVVIEKIDVLVKLWFPFVNVILDKLPYFIDILLPEMTNCFDQDVNEVGCVLQVLVLTKISVEKQIFNIYETLKFILKNPSRLSFYMLHFILNRDFLTDDLQDKLRCFHILFCNILSSVKKVSRSLPEECYGDYIGLNKEYIQIVEKLKYLLTNQSKGLSQKPLSKWACLSKKEVTMLPSMGESRDQSLFCLLVAEEISETRRNGLLEEVLTSSLGEKLRRDIEQMFSSDICLVEDDESQGSSVTDEYQLDGSVRWDVDFDIMQEQNMKQEVLTESNVNSVKNLDLNQINFF